MALNYDVVDTVRPLTDAQLPVLDHWYNEPRLREFIEFARGNEWREAEAPNHLDGVLVDRSSLNVLQIVAVPRPTVTICR